MMTPQCSNHFSSNQLSLRIQVPVNHSPIFFLFHSSSQHAVILHHCFVLCAQAVPIHCLNSISQNWNGYQLNPAHKRQEIISSLRIKIFNRKIWMICIMWFRKIHTFSRTKYFMLSSSSLISGISSSSSSSSRTYQNAFHVTEKIPSQYWISR